LAGRDYRRVAIIKLTTRAARTSASGAGSLTGHR
jgi:hypothetical protein